MTESEVVSIPRSFWLLDLHESFLDNDLMFHIVKDGYHHLNVGGSASLPAGSERQASTRRTAEAPAIRA
jgi:hypothetical protein